MDLECFRQYCLSLPAITEGFPFNDSSLVREVAGKMFALTDVDLSASISMKYDPEQPLGLHERYAAVQPGYHMNKQHWNTIVMDGSIGRQLLLQWTRDSYDLVVQSLSKKQRLEAGL